jgi:hypothetical protein
MESLSIANFILVLIFIPVSLWGVIEILAMKKSTHKIEYVPLDKEFDNGKAFLKKMYDEEPAETEL